MIYHLDEVLNFDSMGDAQIDMICHPDVVASFDSIDDAQIDMICHPDAIANFHCIPGNQNDFFFSLFFLFFVSYDFSDISYRNKGMCNDFKFFFNVL